MTTETDIIVDKSLKNLKDLRDALSAKIDSSEDLDLYMIASRVPKGLLVQTSPKVIDQAVEGLDDHTIMSDLNQISALIPFCPGLNLVVPVGEIPHLVANLNIVFHNALHNASKTIKPKGTDNAALTEK